MKKRYFFFTVLLIVAALSLGAEPLYSPTWGFRLDLPEEYELSGGDNRNQFSFASSMGAFLDIAVYTNRESVFSLAEELEEELEKKLNNRSKKHTTLYNGTEAVIIELQFSSPQSSGAQFTGWALCLELETLLQPPARGKAFLAAMAYGLDRAELKRLHLSVLDSIEGGERDHRLPGAMTSFFYPRGNWTEQNLAHSTHKAWFRENDAAAAQSVVEREFEVLKLYLDSPKWQEAWKRFYRAIFKDSFDRLGNAAFILERNWNNTALADWKADAHSNPEETKRLGTRSGEAAFIAARALEWVQEFIYERDLEGSDFVNLVTAAQEGRGDCDSRAMLWAVILEHADISAGIMVSREFSHAMGLADVEGQGARLPMKDGNGKEVRWLVAETTTKVALGLIGETVSEVTKWLGIYFR